MAEGNGPVNALDHALRDALKEVYAGLEGMSLLDYKVRILPGGGTAAVTRVIIESGDETGRVWQTVGVSGNIIDASYEALNDAITYKLMLDRVAVPGGMTRPRPSIGLPGNKPLVILSRPQIGDNAGGGGPRHAEFRPHRAAHGQGRFRLAQRQGGGRGCGAAEVLNGVRIFDTLTEGLFDVQHLFATTARKRELNKSVITPALAAAEARDLCARAGGSPSCSGPSAPASPTTRRPWPTCSSPSRPTRSSPA